MARRIVRAFLRHEYREGEVQKEASAAAEAKNDEDDADENWVNIKVLPKPTAYAKQDSVRAALAKSACACRLRHLRASSL